jgi:hypothetical protein
MAPLMNNEKTPPLLPTTLGQFAQNIVFKKKKKCIYIYIYIYIIKFKNDHGVDVSIIIVI